MNKELPASNSNRGFQAADFVLSLVYMLHAGGDWLDDMGKIRADKGLRQLINIDNVPTADALGKWSKRIVTQDGFDGLKDTMRYLNELSLHRKKRVTLDIDATLTASANKNAKWTYKKVKGYMPMVGHIAETGMIVAVDFRDGNVSPFARRYRCSLRRCMEAIYWKRR